MRKSILVHKPNKKIFFTVTRWSSLDNFWNSLCCYLKFCSYTVVLHLMKIDEMVKILCIYSFQVLFNFLKFQRTPGNIYFVPENCSLFFMLCKTKLFILWFQTTIFSEKLILLTWLFNSFFTHFECLVLFKILNFTSTMQRFCHERIQLLVLGFSICFSLVLPARTN